ncbi:MAG: glycosyltransferase [Acidimicrobiales bacterium]
MEAGELVADPGRRWRAGPWVEIVVPVYNEERALAGSIRHLRAYLDESFPFATVVTVVDNGSTDATAVVAADLAAGLDGVRVVRLTAKGRGRALRAVWSTSQAQVVAYMDVDLSTSLDALLPLVAPLLSGHSDVAIGTRLAHGARVVRGPKRELISRVYNLLLKGVLRNGFSDAQCGFKAVRTDVARKLLPQVADDQWFFDTELLVLAERGGYRIHEVPVDWVDDPDSRVNIVQTARDDLIGLVRLCLDRGSYAAADYPADLPEALATFARIGVASTVAYLVLFLCLSGSLGRFVANVVALAVCTAVNTAVHRRHTSARGGEPVRRNVVLGGLTAFSTSVAATSAALGLAALARLASIVAVVALLVAANGAAALVRFVLLRSWMLRSGRASRHAQRGADPTAAESGVRSTRRDGVTVLDVAERKIG